MSDGGDRFAVGAVWVLAVVVVVLLWPVLWLLSLPFRLLRTRLPDLRGTELLRKS